MHVSVQALKEDSFRLWKNTSSTFPFNDLHYTFHQQCMREHDVDLLMAGTDASIRESVEAARSGRKRELVNIRSKIQKAIIELLHLFSCPIDESMEKEFSGVADDFIRQAYEFDPDITDDALYQASRNVLIMNTFQMYFGKDIAVTPSVFAYSMLYPYTDNYLDTFDIDPAAKRDVNDRLLLRLNGISVPIRNSREEIIDQLISLIEKEYDRTLSPQVFESLIAIQNAQVRSVAQLDERTCTQDFLLDVSIEKGGTSVLADGYLVANDVAEPDARFLFRFGVLLQLIDDLQDIREDDASGQQTLAGLFAREKSLHTYTNRLLSFVDEVTEPYIQNQHSQTRRIYDLIERSCRLLIFEAIALNHDRYGDEYCLRMERYSPVHFEYLRTVQRKMSPMHASTRTAMKLNHLKPQNLLRFAAKA